ncbi:hypothetical protein LX73_1063 [Fodinibius salinus]|uniref:Uncharacterized protein n=1 Tax=Fodinibius salinus TaxID=860790 RepID=A0A5D3YIG1_9BACT|nr:hypothetical protein [Fodinibius salinus]TYP93362.1 hypothetical protein LX73_1063 [Fodinibius salinus]
MDIKFVDREKLEATKRRSSKFKPLFEALDKLEADGDAIEVGFEDENHLNSMRTAVYQYNEKNGVRVRSTKDSNRNKIYFYKE